MKPLAPDELEICAAVLRGEEVPCDDSDLVARLITRGLGIELPPRPGLERVSGVCLDLERIRLAVTCTRATAT